MVIVCATDNNFVQHCCIMLVSLLKNNNNVVIYILQEDLDEKNINIISSEVKNQNGIVHFCNIDRLVIDNLPMPKKVNLSHISRATYYRLLMPDLLPSDLEKVIYLDCDIIVNQSIYDLWNTDISNVAIAAVPQIGSGYEAERLGYPLGYGYFNAGVTIVNLKYWREHRIALKLINYLSDNCNTIIYHDQDALNAILYDQCFHLLPKWNLTSMYYSFLFKKRGEIGRAHV